MYACQPRGDLFRRTSTPFLCSLFCAKQSQSVSSRAGSWLVLVHCTSKDWSGRRRLPRDSFLLLSMFPVLVAWRVRAKALGCGLRVCRSGVSLPDTVPSSMGRRADALSVRGRDCRTTWRHRCGQCCAPLERSAFAPFLAHGVAVVRPPGTLFVSGVERVRGSSEKQAAAPVDPRGFPPPSSSARSWNSTQLLSRSPGIQTVRPLPARRARRREYGGNFPQHGQQGGHPTVRPIRGTPYGVASQEDTERLDAIPAADMFHAFPTSSRRADSPPTVTTTPRPAAAVRVGRPLPRPSG